MSDEHSESEFYYYPDQLELQEENKVVMLNLRLTELVPNWSLETAKKKIQAFVKEQKTETLRFRAP